MQGGTSRESVTVPRSITLRGTDGAVLIAPDNSAALRLAADGVLVEGFSILAASGNGIEVAGDRSTIRENRIDGAEIGILCTAGRKNEITGNTISNATVAAIVLQDPGSNTITANTFAGNLQDVLSEGRSNGNQISGNAEESLPAAAARAAAQGRNPENSRAPAVTAATTAAATTGSPAAPAGRGDSGGGRMNPLLTAALLLAAAALLAGVAFAWHRRTQERRESGDPAGTLRSPAATLPAARAFGFPGELQDRYDRIEYVGEGGLGRVFGAVRRSDGQAVAVKIPIAFDEATGRAFLKEMQLWEELRHPNIVTVYSVNILPVPYVEMEYVPRTLEQLEKPVAIGTAVRLVAGIADGLGYAHACGVIHRDIKPHNILLTDDLTPKITDWGMGKVLLRGAETSGSGFSPTYAAPEQLAPKQYGSTGPGTDLYQLGVVLYELLTGAAPFSGESVGEISMAILGDAPVPPSQVRPGTEALDSVVLRCLEKDPERRYRSAADLRADLTGDAASP
ncbi:serine/threonine protein kinase [Methanoculleus sp. FWC-SCC1]|uniref:Serine/threonine protein kinase n=1 Tax=Methanoculleus frigidifontis TaxID=2584085 RepID=A0ABT8M808_9EURY|nr:protein kinase [Methanoculleus sp. FWC-SCC1]MDN7024075.1 serine/threonine protein kinase [Methanoculleus sp. FWC-SCC1]